jgi:hypothetical protein
VTEPLEVNSPKWWAEHGVGDEVRAARPYVRWTTDDLKPVRAAYAGLSAGQLRTLTRWARQSDGLVIYRHSFERVPVGEFRYVYPEIRPDHAICTETIWHYHGSTTGDPPRHPHSGNPLPAKQVHTPESMPRHIARDRDPDDHRGMNSDLVHSHRAMAKYLFPPSSTGSVPWIHSHRDEYWARVLVHLLPMSGEEGEWYEPDVSDDERERLEAAFAGWFEQHARRRHPDMDAARLLKKVRDLDDDSLHEHDVRIKRSGEQLAKRIDVHPLVWAQDGLEHAERFFFGIEGCIKADAILTALLRAGQPPAVFSVPSVSLWEATYPALVGEDDDESWLPPIESEDGDSGDEPPPEFSSYPGDELATFADRYLLGKLVCIVPDADAYTKPEVMTQALLCRSALRQLGARGEIVLPPDDRLDEGIKGIDDYLGKGAGSLDDLIWYRKEPPDADEIEEWLRRQPRERPWTNRGLRRAIETLRALATHAGETGEYTASIRLLSRAIGRRNSSPDEPTDSTAEDAERNVEAARQRFLRGIDDLLDIGAISANKPLGVRVGTWLRGRSGWRLHGGFHWEEDGVVITINEDLRAPADRPSIRDLT